MALRHPQPGQHEERAEHVDRVVEGVEQRRAGEDEDRAQHDRADDAPVDDAPLVRGRHGEVAEDQREHEQVVDRERLLDQEAGQVLLGGRAALPPPEGSRRSRRRAASSRRSSPPPAAATPARSGLRTRRGRRATSRRRTRRTRPTSIASSAMQHPSFVSRSYWSAKVSPAASAAGATGPSGRGVTMTPVRDTAPRTDHGTRAGEPRTAAAAATTGSSRGDSVPGMSSPTTLHSPASCATTRSRASCATSRIDTQADRDVDELPEHDEAARALAHARRASCTSSRSRTLELTEHGYVFATLPGARRARRSACCAHVDVSPDAPAADVQPQVHESYDGGELVAGLSPETSALLARAHRARHRHLRRDDPARRRRQGRRSPRSWPRSRGSSPIPRCRTRPRAIAFTVDEEIGRGVDHFDLEAFGADFAYTLDGSVVGEIENETWSAVELKVTFHGVGVHPGTAKGKLVNPIKAAARFVDEPAGRRRSSPETTEGREGFVHPHRDRGRLDGGHGHADPARLRVGDAARARGARCGGSREEAIADEPRASVTFERWEQYRNMRDGAGRGAARRRGARSRRRGAPGSSRRCTRSAAAPTARG